VLDRQGNVGVAHNAPYLVFAQVTPGGSIISRISAVHHVQV
jgi:hypothetical protein